MLCKTASSMCALSVSKIASLVLSRSFYMTVNTSVTTKMNVVISMTRPMVFPREAS